MKHNQRISGYEKILAITILIIGGIIFSNSYLFTISKVIVKGNHRLTKEDIVLTAGINPGETYFQVNRVKISQALLRNPEIAKVQVVRQFPNKLEIIVQERLPLCLIKVGSNLLLIGNDAVVMGVSSHKELNLPLVTGIKLSELEIGKKVTSQEFKSVLEMLGFCDDSLRQLLTEIDWRNYRLRLESFNDQVLLVELGNPTQLDRKMTNLRSILSQTNLNKLIKIDLRIPDIPTVLNQES